MSAATSMSSVERHYFEQVGAQCQDDVNQFCGNGAFQPTAGPFSLLNEMPSFFMMNELPSIVDSLMKSALTDFAQVPEFPAAPQNVEAQAPRTIVTVRSSSSPMMMMTENNNSPFEDLFVRQMLSQFVPMVTVHETDSLAQRLSEHGHVMLERIPEQGSNEFRIARRLSEVTADDVNKVRNDLFLPFGPEKSQCLFEAYHQRRVSQDCGNSLYALEQTRAARIHKQAVAREYEEDAFEKLSLMYFFIFATAVVLYCCRRSATAKAESQSPEFVQRLKSARLMTVICFSAMSILCILGMLPVQVLLQACVWFSAFVCLRAVCSSACCDDEDDEVGCCDCCAGGCCGEGCCCMGDGGCCDGGCCCCKADNAADYKLMSDDDEEANPAKKVVTRKTFVLHEGVPVQVV